MNGVAVMHSGQKVNVAQPHASMIQLRDIAAHLAKQCMFAGASHTFYSRAQHGMIIAGEMQNREGPIGALYGLLQNAHHAVETTDALTAEKVSRAIHDAVDLDWPAPQTITRALLIVSARVELAEITQLVTGWEDRAAYLTGIGVAPIRKLIRPLTWDRAQDAWLDNIRSNAVAANIPHLPAFGDIL